MAPVPPRFVADCPTVTTAVGASDTAERGLIPRVLVPALRWWLLSQLDVAEGLDLNIKGSDRQLLRGHLPCVQVGAAVASYRGIRLQQVALQAEHIRINLGQVVRGKPLKLLAPVLVCGELVLTQADLQTSIGSPLLQAGLGFLLRQLEQRGVGKADAKGKSWQMISAAVTLGAAQIELAFTMQNAQQEQACWICTSRVRLEDERTLCLEQLQWRGEETVHPLVKIDLGEGVALDHLSLSAAALRMHGRICLYP